MAARRETARLGAQQTTHNNNTYHHNNEAHTTTFTPQTTPARHATTTTTNTQYDQDDQRLQRQKDVLDDVDRNAPPRAAKVPPSHSNATADADADAAPIEHGGPRGKEPTRFGDWEKNGRVSDF